MNLDELEVIINGSARRYARNSAEIEDMTQIGRIAAWQISENKPDAQIGYYVVSIRNAMLGMINRDNVKKRRPEGKLVSLQTPLGEEGFTIEDTLGVTDEEFFDKKDLMQVIKDELTQQFGKNYFTNISKEPHPRRLIGKIVRGVIEEVAKIPEDQIPTQADYKFFVDHGLGRMLWVFYKNSPFRAVNDAYPDKFLRWEFNRVPDGFWKGKDGYDNAIQAVKWFADKNNLKDKKDCANISLEDFEKAGVGNMVQQVFNDSPFLALKSIFPDLKPWESRSMPRGFLDSIENQRMAVDDYLLSNNVPLLSQLNPEETYDVGLRKFVSKESMSNFGLTGLLARFNNSTYKLFSTLYPEQILPWTLNSSKEVWKDKPKETAAKAVRWLFENYLMIPKSEISSYASNNFFWNLGFSGILTNRNIGFNSSTYKAIDNAYPGEFIPSDFRRGKGRVISFHDKDLRRSR